MAPAAPGCDGDRVIADSPHLGIHVRGLARSFGHVQAVAHMDLDARPGRVTGLVGPNGAGKTTLMLVVAGLLRPDAGTVRVAGVDPVTRTAEVHARLGWMPDSLGAWDSLTAREHLTTYAAAYRVPGPSRRERVAGLLAMVDLEHLADTPARALSRGQKQRLGLARTLVHDPAVVVLDEPASGLDPGSRAALRVLLRRLAGEGRTVLVSSHILSDLDEVADDAVYVLGGRTVDASHLAAGAASTWRIKALDGGALVRALLARGVVPGQPADDGTVEVAVEDDEAAADLVDALVAAGVRLVSFSPAGGRIERTYLGLAEAEVRARAEAPAPAPGQVVGMIVEDGR